MNKPKCKLVGMDGNVYSIISRVCQALKKAGLKDKAEEFKKKAFSSESYDKVLCLCLEYVDEPDYEDEDENDDEYDDEEE